MFCKTVVLTISGESREVTCSFRRMLEKSFKFTFNAVTFQIFFQRFYLDFKLLHLLRFRFPRALIFQNTSFSHPFTVAGRGFTRQLTSWELVVLLNFFAFLRCLRLLESSLKILDIMLIV